MLFPKDFPEKLRSTILVSEIVGKKVKLKLRGKEFQGLCPFHNEKSPSFTVNDQKGFYHCFGCAAHGDVISFVMNVEGLDYPAAVAKLADDFGIPIPRVTVDQVKETRLDRDYLILEKICQFFEKNLFEVSGKNAFIYLQKRGISQATIKKFRLGFALNSFEALTNFLRTEKFTDQEISRTGVIGQNEQKKFYDKFRNRVIFPITDKKNRVIAFGGRTIGEDLPKYLNSAETEIFKKNQTLYNFYYARKPIFSKGFAVVVEGYMDAISLMMNGVENVVAGLGTALGEAHLKELFYITDKIVICLDGDSAGVRAAKRVSEIVLPLISAKKNISFTLLPNQMDPDDFIKEFGAAEIEKIFKESAPLSESLFEFALLELGIDKNTKISAENKAKIEANLTNKIEVINDISSKKYFSLFFKDSLFLLGKNQKQSPKIFSNFSKKSYANFNNNAADALAKSIIAFIIKHPQLAQFRDDQFDIKELHFNNENLSHLKELVIELIENNPDLNEKILLETLEKSATDKDIEKTAKEIRVILTHLGDEDLNLILSKFRILLLKDLLLQVDQQYKSILGQIDEIETHQSAITNQKIKEIFSYKNSLEQEIFALEKEII
jgi:DNA primase